MVRRVHVSVEGAKVYACLLATVAIFLNIHAWVAFVFFLAVGFNRRKK